MAHSVASAVASGCPVLHATGSVVIRSRSKPVGDDGAVARVERDPAFARGCRETVAQTRPWWCGSARSPG